MVFYTIIPQEDGKFAVEIGGNAKPIISGPFQTTIAARAYIADQKQMALALAGRELG